MSGDGRAKSADALCSAPRGVGPAGMPCERPCACCGEGPGRIWWPSEAAGVGPWASRPSLDTCSLPAGPGGFTAGSLGQSRW